MVSSMVSPWQSLIAVTGTDWPMRWTRAMAWSSMDGVDHGFETILLRHLTKEIDLDGSLEKQIQAMTDAGVRIENAA